MDRWSRRPPPAARPPARRCPQNTPRRRNTVCCSVDSRPLLHSSAARSVCCRAGASRLPLVSTRKRSPRRLRSPSMPRSGTRAAASSIAKRDAIELSANIDRRSTVVAVSVKCGSTAFARASNSARAPDCRAAWSDFSTGSASGAKPEDLLARELQRLLAGRQPVHSRDRGTEPLHQLGDSVQHVFAVVEHHEEPARPDRMGDCFQCRAVAKLDLQASSRRWSPPATHR